MEARVVKVFCATFLVAAVVVFGGWFAVDGLANLDEIFGSADAQGVGVAVMAARHFSGVVRSRGVLVLLAIASIAAAVAVAGPDRGTGADRASQAEKVGRRCGSSTESGTGRSSKHISFASWRWWACMS